MSDYTSITIDRTLNDTIRRAFELIEARQELTRDERIQLIETLIRPYVNEQIFISPQLEAEASHGET
jgi:hypothetical protein